MQSLQRSVDRATRDAHECNVDSLPPGLADHRTPTSRNAPSQLDRFTWTRRGVRGVLVFSLALSVWACGEDDPDETPRSDAGATDVDGDTSDPDVVLPPIAETCSARATDYAPGSPGTGWSACVSDSGDYVQIEENISSIARIASYEDIADLLWRSGVPNSEAFIAAREIFATPEGLDSRVQRREDEHLPPVVGDDGEVLRCRDEGVPERDPNRCVGPAQMLPIFNDAFQRGIAGEEPEVQAARIDATLLWFLYLSAHKEAVTCTTVRRDCDSAYAYYTGGQPRDGGVGLAGAFLRDVPQAHERAWDGVLAVRCWRDLDRAETAENLALRDQAVEQLDRALLHGVSRLVVQRFRLMRARAADARAPDWAWLQIMGGALDREASERDAEQASVLRDLFAGAIPTDDEIDDIVDAITALFPCD